MVKTMADFEDAVATAKDKLPNVTPTPPGFHPQANAYEVKSRLQWGEPGLTLVDVRNHDDFNQCRIMGAISIPQEDLAEIASFALLHKRDIYVYGASDDETTAAANQLREMGFERVAELKGGLAAWKEISGPMEGPGSDQPPSAGAYNVGDRLREFAQVKARERSMK